MPFRKRPSCMRPKCRRWCSSFTCQASPQPPTGGQQTNKQTIECARGGGSKDLRRTNYEAARRLGVVQLVAPIGHRADLARLDTDTVELTVKLLLRRLITGELNSPANSYRLIIDLLLHRRRRDEFRRGPAPPLDPL
eukprot:1903077-Pyramimonas_sp.AAC.2